MPAKTATVSAPANAQPIHGLGQNIIASLDSNGILHIAIDTNTFVGPSASGKSTLVASTGPAKDLPIAGMKLQLSVYSALKPAVNGHAK